MTKKNTSNIVSKDETVEERPWSLALRARVATISVASAGMLFCAVFWPSVLDFKQKIAGNAFDETGAVADSSADKTGSELSAAAERESDWRSKLDALYPHGNFVDEQFSTRENQRALYSDEDPTLRAARFNTFDPMAQDSVLSDDPYAELSDDDSELIAAAPFDDPLLDAPLPSAATSFLAGNVQEPARDVEASWAKPADSQYLVARTDPKYPELDAPSRQVLTDDAFPASLANQNAPTNATPDALTRRAPEPLPTALPETSTGDAHAPFQPSDAGFASNYADSYASLDDSRGVSSELNADSQFADDPLFPTLNDEFAPLSDPGVPEEDPLLSAPLPSNSSRVASTCYDAPVASSYDAVLEPLREEPVAERATTTQTPAKETVDAAPSENAEPTVPRQSASEAALSPSYFSRAVGLYGGSSNFTALYFARAAELVGDSDAWSPETVSRFFPAPRTDASQPETNQNVVPAPESATHSATATPDKSETRETPSSQTSLVGYIERERVGESKNAPIRSAAY